MKAESIQSSNQRLIKKLMQFSGLGGKPISDRNFKLKGFTFPKLVRTLAVIGFFERFKSTNENQLVIEILNWRKIGLNSSPTDLIGF